jgi:hypothetical protein
VKVYRYLIISYSVRASGNKKGVDLYCTHPETLDWLLEEAAVYAPNVATRFEREDIQGEHHFFQLHKLANRDYAMAHWLFRRACEEGWRPLSAQTPPEVGIFRNHKYDEFTFKLMKEYEA